METLQLFFFSFLGGIFLNVMPCVLPVLTLKAFTILDHARAEPRQQRMHGLAYAFGTMSALAAFGAVVVALRSAGKLFGWGMQFQHPAFVATLTTVVFIFALNALGVFEITFGMAEDADDEKKHDGLFGSVANGWLAAVMGTPCSAPFLGTAAAFAMAAGTPAWKTLTMFTLVGAGLAFPFTLLSFVPALTRRLPRPGGWMETVKAVMGFSLMGTAVWLYRVLLTQVTIDSGILFLGLLVLVALGAWSVNRFAHLRASTTRRWGVRLGVVAALATAFSFLTLEKSHKDLSLENCVATTAQPVHDDHIHWIPFTPARVEKELAAGRTVFLDFTAEWCTSCKANEKLILETDAVRSAIVRTGVVPVRVDMTDSDDTSDAWRARLGRGRDIPAYALLRGTTTNLLPVVITVQSVVAALEASVQK